MNDDRKTPFPCGDQQAHDGQVAQHDEQQTREDAGTVDSLAANPTLLDEPVPPPPTAPTEFLRSQWLELQPPSKNYRKTGDPLAPPPASAPEEFLSAQWMGGVVPETSASETDQAIFENALPAAIECSSQLHSLGVEPGPSVESPATGGGGIPERGIEAAPTRIREVALAPDEEITMVFLPDEGVVDSVPRTGQALILTSDRLIAFRGMEGFRDTHMAMASEISQCSVRTGQRNWTAILQGLTIMAGGAFLYLIVGYWLAGQVSGPNVPVLNIDVAPLIALLIILTGLLVLASNYFTRPAGALIFHGEGVDIAFPFRSSLGLAQVYDFVDRAHLVRRRKEAIVTVENRSGGDQ